MTWARTFNFFQLKSHVLSNLRTLWAWKLGVVVISPITKRCIDWVMTRSKLLLMILKLHFHAFQGDFSICLSLRRIFFKKLPHILSCVAHLWKYMSLGLEIFSPLEGYQSGIYSNFYQNCIPFFWSNWKKISLIYYKLHLKAHSQYWQTVAYYQNQN